MPFPDSDRVKFERNALKEVICQVRYPTLLKIEAEPPAAFQELVRAEYPIYKKEREYSFLISKQPQGADVSAPSVTARLQHKFSSTNGSQSITLYQDFIAITERNYVSWEEFLPKITSMVNAFEQAYGDATFTRLGLRYVDVIVRSELQLEDRAWPDLLKDALVGELTIEEIGEAVTAMSTDFTIKLEEHLGNMHVKHGLGRSSGSEEEIYILDADMYKDNPDNERINEILTHYNKLAGNFFRWCISDTLRRALRPGALSH